MSFDPPRDRQPTVVVDRRPVAGVEPSAARERTGVVGRVRVAGEHLGPAHEQLAVRAQPHLDLADRAAIGLAGAFDGVAGGARRDRRASVEP